MSVDFWMNGRFCTEESAMRRISDNGNGGCLLLMVMVMVMRRGGVQHKQGMAGWFQVEPSPKQQQQQQQKQPKQTENKQQINFLWKLIKLHNYIMKYKLQL
jgi:hypothetical protein